MRHFNDQDFYLAEIALKNKDVVYFNWFKNGAVERLKYLKPLLDELKSKEMNLYDVDEKYVIVFEPKLDQNVYFLLTAYYLEGKDAQRDKIVKKYKRKLDEVL